MLLQGPNNGHVFSLNGKLEGALRSFGEEIFIRRERSSQIFLCLYKLNTPTVFFFMHE